MVKQANPLYELGTTFTVGTFEVKIENVTRDEDVQNERSLKGFVVYDIELTLKNIGTKDLWRYSSFNTFSLTNILGADFWDCEPTDSNLGLVLKDITIGQTINGALAYRVPQEESEVYLVVSDSGETKVVKLF